VTFQCLIVDDSEAFLASATRLLQSEGFAVVGTATSSSQALNLARELKPDVVLVDVELGEESGFEIVRRLACAVPGTSSILISMYPDVDLQDAIATSPALGFISKSKLSGGAVRRLLTPPSGVRSG
jgi:DNA-binding NarL/FixJ family response regulator